MGVQYIFKPLVKMSSRAIMLVVASMLTFGFTCFWHAADWSIILWAAFSWVGWIVETSVSKVGTAKFGWMYSRRLRCILATLPFSWIIINNQFFLAGHTVGWIYIQRIYTESLWKTLAFHFGLYFGAQVWYTNTRT